MTTRVAFTAAPELEDTGVLKIAITYRGRTVVVNAADLDPRGHAKLNNELLEAVDRSETERHEAECPTRFVERAVRLLPALPSRIAPLALTAGMFSLTACVPG